MPKRAVNCSIAKSLAVIGERWSLLVIREAVMGTTRFDDFQARLGIARNILNTRLVNLVNDDILEKKASEHSARIFHYTLTAKGRDLLPVLVSIMQWGDRWIHKDIGAPIILRDKKSCQSISDVRLTSERGTPLTLDDIVITPGPGATSVMRRRLQ
jgi:DNA-binding HxlR family transcriptional regulator